jgi:hypothetical protein
VLLRAKFSDAEINRMIVTARRVLASGEEMSR